MIRLQHGKHQRLAQIHHACQSLGLPWVSYRLPMQKEAVTVIHLDKTPATFGRGAVDGFVVAPFDFPEKTAYWLRNDLVFTGFTIDPSQGRCGSLQAGQLLTMNQFYAALENGSQPSDRINYIDRTSAIERPHYSALVNKALDQIGRGKLEKVVLSRLALLDLPADFNPASMFESLCTLYPDAFVSLFEIPGAGCWIGASPELLLARRGDHYETMSLAGTRSAAGSWQAKEENEQALVTRYIRQQLEAAGLQVAVGALETVQAGQVFHLRNRISAEGYAGVFDIVRRLHPTPAVCGLPLAEARDFIAAEEPHKRAFYSGFLGPIAANGAADLYVNLRAAQLYPNTAALYLGGGIVQGSQADAEWLETEAKAATLIEAIHHAG
jgi:isochorismate synthase